MNTLNFFNVKINYRDLELGELESELSMGQCLVTLKDREAISKLKGCDYVENTGTGLNHRLEDIEAGEDLVLIEPDDVILLLHILTQYEEFNTKSYEIDACYDHLIWLLHDFSHVINDVGEHGRFGALAIQVFEWSERAAIERSIDVLLDLEIPLPIHILEQTSIEFEKRFKHELGLSHMWADYVNDYSNVAKFSANDWF